MAACSIIHAAANLPSHDDAEKCGHCGSFLRPWTGQRTAKAALTYPGCGFHEQQIPGGKIWQNECGVLSSVPPQTRLQTPGSAPARQAPIPYLHLLLGVDDQQILR